MARHSGWFLAVLAAAVLGTACTPALESAVYSGNADNLRQLLDNGADANQGGGALLRLAAESGQTDIARMLVERGADVNAKTANGRTSLMVAAAFGQLDVVKLLLPKVTDVNAMTTEKETALSMAVEENHPDVIEALLAAGADPAIGEVWTIAERAGRFETVRMLRKAKAAHAAPARAPAPQGDAAP